jgi:ribosomal protein L44E
MPKSVQSREAEQLERQQWETYRQQWTPGGIYSANLGKPATPAKRSRLRSVCPHCGAGLDLAVPTEHLVCSYCTGHTTREIDP